MPLFGIRQQHRKWYKYWGQVNPGDKEVIYNNLQVAIQSARELIPDVEVALIPEAHHITALSQPEKVNRKLLQFFEG